jgi:GTP cyclohydrolase II
MRPVSGRHGKHPSVVAKTDGATKQTRGPLPLQWGAATPELRGPVVATLRNRAHRNAIGAHAGGYSVYRALAIAARTLARDHLADLTGTAPVSQVGPFAQWADPGTIVSIDPWGHLIGSAFSEHLAQGYDIRPTIAITRARIDIPEIRAAIDAGRLRRDGTVVSEHGSVRVMKAAIDPVWYLPGIATRFGISEDVLRRSLHDHTAGMYRELVERNDLKVFLPPIGGTTVYCFGDPEKLGEDRVPVACRVHDECNGSDVFSSDICTCRPYLTHGLEVCIETAQAGGVGLIIYNRKEGRALGEVTKFLVYNARKRQHGGDRADAYFKRTECVAGVEDMRFQELMPDVLHWLGVKHIHRFASMSNVKRDALIRQGISIGEQVQLPEHMIPPDARIEIAAKIAAGYFAAGRQRAPDATLGRALTD